MSEFELRRRLQALKTERQPERDLWPAIAAQLQTPSWRPARAPRRVMLPWAAAASVALAVVAGVWLASHLGEMTSGRRGDSAVAARDTLVRPAGPALLQGEARAMQASFDGAIAAATGEHKLRAGHHGSRRELEAAARELDAATAQLNSALAQEPDAAYLVELLKRTQERRVALAKLGMRSA
ncbi:MAG TPA: hypothetical protein VND91_05330 [Candidatus Saccharimonadia bacterium]|nr:hypothetical protein [Candidatus Saccharimonadia bacterium]